MTTITITPERERQQAVALEKAQRHRMARAEIKRELFSMPSMTESREACARILLEDPPSHLVTMRVEELIAACRGTGAKRARVMLRRAGVSDRKVIGQLSVDQALAIRGQMCAGEQLELPA